VPGANHIAWQIGHLVRAEANFLGNNFPGTAAAELPLGFAERHSKEAAKADDGFATKAEYLDLFGKVRSATLAALEAMPDTDLDRPTAGPIAALAPTVGQALAFTGIHTMMHTGQFSVVRRKLGKPILF
jgi:hypothetical protein